MLTRRRTLKRDTLGEDRYQLLNGALTFLLVSQLEVSTDKGAFLLKSGLFGDVATTDGVASAWVSLVLI